MTSTSRGDEWAREGDLALREATDEDLLDPAMQRALRDNIERGYEGELPDLPPGVECHAIEAAGTLVGLLGVRRGVPQAGAMTVDVLAIATEERGHAYATRALLLAEQRLAVDGIVEGYARVPRGNGRGMYFMLRCGYAPVNPPTGLGGGEDDWGAGVTWFRRNPGLEPRGSERDVHEPTAASPQRPRRP